MTREEWESMTPAERDAVVVERGMGWTNKAKAPGLYWSPEKHRTQMVPNSPFHDTRTKIGITEDAVGDGFVFAPTRDISAAMEVAEHVAQSMNNTTEVRTYSIYPRSGDTSVHHCTIIDMFNDSNCGQACDMESLPEAICLASLRAKEQ